MLGIWAADADASKQVCLVLARVHSGVVEHFADLYAALEQRFAGCRDIGDDQIQALRGAGRRRGDVLAEDDRAPGSRRRELSYAETFPAVVVGVEPPAKLRVERFGAVHIRDGDHYDLEFHIASRGGGVDAGYCVRAHSCLPGFMIYLPSLP